MRAAIVFPGQGSQFVGMADVWTTHDAARAVLDDATDAIGRDVVAGSRDEGALATTEFVQPAILACDVAAFRVLEALGVGFVGAAGHSLGEFAALVAAGVLELTDALRIVAVRGRAMQAAGEARPGTMTALLGVGSRTPGGAVRRGSRRRRAARRERELAAAGGDQRQRRRRSNARRPSPPNGSSGPCA